MASKQEVQQRREMLLEVVRSLPTRGIKSITTAYAKLHWPDYDKIYAAHDVDYEVTGPAKSCPLWQRFNPSRNAHRWLQHTTNRELQKIKDRWGMRRVLSTLGGEKEELPKLREAKYVVDRDLHMMRMLRRSEDYVAAREKVKRSGTAEEKEKVYATGVAVIRELTRELAKWLAEVNPKEEDKQLLLEELVPVLRDLCARKKHGVLRKLGVCEVCGRQEGAK